MTAIDRAALIEAAAKAIHGAQDVDWRNWGNTNQALYLKQAEAVLPAVVAAALKPLRELHFAKAYTCIHLPPAGELGPCCRHEICATCNQMHPCPTVRLLDQIESDAKGDE